MENHKKEKVLVCSVCQKEGEEEKFATIFHCSRGQRKTASDLRLCESCFNEIWESAKKDESVDV